MHDSASLSFMLRAGPLPGLLERSPGDGLLWLEYEMSLRGLCVECLVPRWQQYFGRLCKLYDLEL